MRSAAGKWPHTAVSRWAASGSASTLSAPRAAKSSPYDSASVKAVRRCTQPPWVAMSPPSPIRLVTTTARPGPGPGGPPGVSSGRT